jgi:uncharacterized protein (DUF302 family)
MKKTLTAILISLVIGIVAGVIIATQLFVPETMLENESRYDFETTLSTIEQSVTNAGWSMPAVHDLQKSLARAGKEVNPVRVFAICNPERAVGILSGDEERIYSNMMPCRISVYTKTDGKTYISRMNIPGATKGMPANVKAIMKEAYRDVEGILSGIILD